VFITESFSYMLTSLIFYQLHICIYTSKITLKQSECMVSSEHTWFLNFTA